MDGQTLAVGFLLLFNWAFCVLTRLFVPLAYRKHVNLLLGLVSGFAIYRAYMLLVIAGSLLAYLFFHLPGAYCIFSLLVPFAGLMAVHLDRLWNYDKTDWGSDLSAIVMFHSLRIMMLAFNIYDGRCAEIKRRQWTRFAVKAVPSLFDYMSYLFCFMGLISGPVYPYKIYDECCEMDSTPEKVEADIKDGFLTFCKSVLAVIIFLVSNYFLPNRFIASDEFQSHNYFVKMLLLLVIGNGRNMRYFFAWLSGEAAFRSFGLTRVQDFDFDEIRSIRVSKFMLCRDLGEMISEWHYTVSTTLKEYLYLRLIIHLRCPSMLARILVFAFSAYWHGFFSGYVVLASMATLFSVADRVRRLRFSPIVERVIGERWGYWFNVFCSHVIVWFVTAPWDLLWASKYLEFYRGMYFGPFVACLVMCGIGFAFGPRPPAARKVEKAE
jgi:hypothetical protein